MTTTFSILTISGSLREASAATAILRTLSSIAPEGCAITIYDRLGDLPHFNPDIDIEPFPESVLHLREAVAKADGIIIGTPEYAFAMPGALKNAFDWLVSSGELLYKPTVTISSSPLASGGENAHASLLLVMKALSTAIPEGGSLNIPFTKKRISAEGNITDPVLLDELRAIVDALIKKIQNKG